MPSGVAGRRWQPVLDLAVDQPVGLMRSPSLTPLWLKAASTDLP